MKFTCDMCHNDFEVTHLIHYPDESTCVVCTHCGSTLCVDDNVEIEFSAEQLARLDNMYSAAAEFCRVLAEDPKLEENTEFIGEIVDYAVDTLVEKLRRPIRYPGIVTTYDSSGIRSEVMEDNVEPITRNNVMQVITDASGHRIHRNK